MEPRKAGDKSRALCQALTDWLFPASAWYFIAPCRHFPIEIDHDLWWPGMEVLALIKVVGEC